MKVLFFCLGDFKAPPGARQILLLAQALERAGHQTMVLVEGDPATIRLVRGGAGDVRVGAYGFRGPRLDGTTRALVRDFAPDVIHCYEPRTAPLSAALAAAAMTDAPLCVRFADDDELLYREAGGEGWRGKLGRPALLALGTALPKRWPYKHPLHHQRMLRRAKGYDAITPALATEISGRYGVPCEGILPAVPAHDLPPADPGVRARLGLPQDAQIVVYTGSVFRAHYPDFELLLKAFGALAERFPNAVLAHTGRIGERYPETELRRIAGAGGDRLRFLGFLEQPSDLTALMAEASVLVQPGAPNDFNRLRLPAKVHDYLLAGRPVVTFEVGFGQLLTDRVEAVLTKTDSPAELADAMGYVLDDPERAERIASAGRAKAIELFAPERVAQETERYYQRALGRVRA